MSDLSAHIAALLDGGAGDELTDSARMELNHLLRNDPAAAAEYCRQMRIHALLTWKHDRMRDPAPATADTRKTFAILRRRWISAAAAALILAGGSLMLFAPRSADAAAAALDRMIDVTARAGGRTYQLHVLEGSREFQLVNGQTASCEGARLHLGRGGQFVYECDLSDGTRRITGSDGRTSWDIIGPAPVHLSPDPARFRHHLPGEQADFTYLDPGAQLALMREGYEVSLAAGENGLKKLRAVKRSRVFRGPKEAIVQFEEDSGTIRSIDLYGLPLAKGGPSALRLTLTEEPAFPDGFFSHAHHHEPGRSVEIESGAPPPRRR